jgi:site-specific recombinase XerC
LLTCKNTTATGAISANTDFKREFSRLKRPFRSCLKVQNWLIAPQLRVKPDVTAPKQPPRIPQKADVDRTVLILVQGGIEPQ